MNEYKLKIKQKSCRNLDIVYLSGEYNIMDQALQWVFLHLHVFKISLKSARFPCIEHPVFPFLLQA